MLVPVDDDDEVVEVVPEAEEPAPLVDDCVPVRPLPLPEPPTTPKLEPDGHWASEPLHTPDGHKAGDVTGQPRDGQAASVAAHVRSGHRTSVTEHGVDDWHCV
jgi:hypothetical protein